MTSHILENMNEAITNNYSNTHQAVDVVAAGNNIDDVIAVSDGIVEMVVKDVKYTNHNTTGTATYGNFVKIKHSNGKKTLYAHLKYGSVTVSTGQTVSKGQKIGTMGATGNAYGAHLHFEVRNSNETRENPNEYLNGNLSLDPVKIEEPKVEVKAKEENNEEEAIVDNNNEEEVEAKEEIPLENNIKINQKKDEKEIINNNWEESKNITNDKNSNDCTSDNNKDNHTILENSNYYGGSIVDGLKGIKIDSSFDNRTIIAEKNGIENYRGTYNQNVYLLKLLKQGKLKA